jgi:hypothetical protein
MAVTQRLDERHNGFLRLLHVVRNARAPSHGITVILGAGCSLTSSSEPLTTESIVRGLVEEIAGTDASRAWPADRVWNEFVRHWDNFGHADRLRYLGSRLVNAKPSTGYALLGKLVTDGYVRRIVTTNFDLLLDRTLAAVPSIIRIGLSSSVRHGDGTPMVEVVKVHGDISGTQENGAPLRFSPHELDRLPDSLRTIVRQATALPTVVIGYSGADRGLMQALNDQSDHTAFWIVPDGLGVLSSYTGQEMGAWLAKRRATDNIIDGPEFGYFDSFMDQLAACLIDGRELITRRYTNIPSYWLDTSLLRQLSENYHIQQVASAFFEVMTWSLQGLRWNSNKPPFSSSFEETAGASALLFRQLALSAVFAGIPRNEAEALLLMLGVEFRARLAGIDLPASQILERVREGFHARHANYEPHTSFWDALEYLVAERPSAVPTDELRLKLNCQNRLTLIVSDVPLCEMRSLLDVVDVLNIVHLSGSSGALANSALALCYETFKTHAVDLRVKDGVILCQIAGLSLEAFRRIYECLLSFLPDAILVDGGLAVRSRHVHVVLAAGDESLAEPVNHSNGLFQLIERQAKLSQSAFHAKITPLQLPIKEHIARDHDRRLVDFLSGPKPAAILVGPSGSGKSVSVDQMLAYERQQHNTLCVVVEGCALRDANPMAAAFPELALVDGVPSPEARIAAAVIAHGRQLLLIVDGLNEASADPKVIAQRWRDLISLADHLGRLDGCPIKLLVTCREGTLAALVDEKPVPSSLFITGDVLDEDAKPWLTVPPLKPNEIRAILQLNLGEGASKASAVISAEQALTNLYSRPFWLAMAIREIATGTEPAALYNPRRLVGKICDNLLASTLPSAEDQVALQELLDAGFGETVDRPGNRGRNFGFAARRVFGWDRKEQLIRIVRGLIDAGVAFPTSANVLSDLRFTHDQVEEHFLGMFMLRRFEEGGGDDILYRCASGQYFVNGLRALLSALDDGPVSKTRLSHVIGILRAHEGDRASLAEIVAEAFEVRSDLKGDLQAISAAETDPRSQSALATFLISGMNRLIESGRTIIPDHLSAALSDVLGKNTPHQQAETALIRSYCAYRCDQYVAAAALAEHAAAMLAGNVECDYGLRDLIEKQQGVLHSKMGDKAAAITSFEVIYRRCKTLGRPREAFEIGLELGAVHRDRSEFEAALTIYDEIGLWRDEVPAFSECRRRLQIGTAKKNLLQKIVEPVRYGEQVFAKEELRKAHAFFVEARQAIEMAEQWATENDASQLWLACLSERAECLLVMAYVEPTLLRECDVALTQLSVALDRQEMVSRRIEYHREMARFAEIHSGIAKDCDLRKRHTEDAIEQLRKARAISSKHGLGYQICECDYQMARLCLRVLRCGGRSALYYWGLDAIENVVAYYNHNQFDNCDYMNSAEAVRCQLREAAAKLGICPPSNGEAEGGRK